jgi:hypothetical protein
MLHDISPDKRGDSDSNAPVTSEQLARQQAIKQMQRKRRFWISTVAWSVIMIFLVVIWATGEYHNAGGWEESSRVVDGVS